MTYWEDLISSLVLTVIIVLAVPITVACVFSYHESKTSRNGLTLNTIRVISVVNAIVAFFVFAVLTALSGGYPTVLPIFIWGSVGHAIMKKLCLKNEDEEFVKQEILKETKPVTLTKPDYNTFYKEDENKKKTAMLNKIVLATAAIVFVGLLSSAIVIHFVKDIPANATIQSSLKSEAEPEYNTETDTPSVSEYTVRELFSSSFITRSPGKYNNTDIKVKGYIHSIEDNKIVITEINLLDEKKDSYLMQLYQNQKLTVYYDDAQKEPRLLPGDYIHAEGILHTNAEDDGTVTRTVTAERVTGTSKEETNPTYNTENDNSSVPEYTVSELIHSSLITRNPDKYNNTDIKVKGYIYYIEDNKIILSNEKHTNGKKDSFFMLLNQHITVYYDDAQKEPRLLHGDYIQAEGILHTNAEDDGTVTRTVTAEKVNRKYA